MSGRRKTGREGGVRPGKGSEAGRGREGERGVRSGRRKRRRRKFGTQGWEGGEDGRGTRSEGRGSMTKQRGGGGGAGNTRRGEARRQEGSEGERAGQRSGSGKGRRGAELRQQLSSQYWLQPNQKLGLLLCVYRVTRVHTKRRASRRTRVKISRKESPGRRVETLYSEKKVEKKGV